MREHGWQGTSLDAKRRIQADRSKMSEKRKQVCLQIAKILGMPDEWWGNHNFDEIGDDHDVNEEDPLVSRTVFCIWYIHLHSQEFTR